MMSSGLKERASGYTGRDVGVLLYMRIVATGKCTICLLAKLS